MDTAVSVEEVRQRTRAAQHATSFPLLVLGVLFINYGTVGFTAEPVAWRYAGALAFVVMWGLAKANEYATGVGPSRVDYLAAACLVFVLTQLTFLNRVVFARWATVYRLEGLWVGIIGLGLLGVGLAGRAPTLIGWAIAVCGVGAAQFFVGYQLWTTNSYFPVVPSAHAVIGLPQPYIVIGLGVVLTLAGLVTFAGERRHW
jgi:hypothetical protein